MIIGLSILIVLVSLAFVTVCIVERRKNKRLQNSYNPNATAYKGQNVYMGTPPTNGTAGPSYYPPNDYPINPNTCKLDYKTKMNNPNIINKLYVHLFLSV